MKTAIFTLLLFFCTSLFSQTDPTSLIFGAYTTLAPYNNAPGYSLVPDAQIQPANMVTDNNRFAATSDFTVVQQDDVTTAFSVAANQGTITTGAAAGAVYTVGSKVTTTKSFPVPETFIEVEIDQNGGATGTDQIGVGIAGSTVGEARATAVRIESVFNQVASQISIGVTVNGTTNNLSAVSFATPTAPWHLAFELLGTTAVAWANTGTGWKRITSQDVSSYYNTESIGNLIGFYASISTLTSQVTTWKVSNLKTGSFGGVGIRDDQIVTNPDGSPFVQNGKVYFTATISDAVGGYVALCTLDLGTYAFQIIGVLASSRGGAYYLDGPKQLIIDTVNGYGKVLTSTWGSEGTPNVRYTSFSLGSINPLNGGFTITAEGPVMADAGAFDGDLTCSNWNGSTGVCTNWLLATTGFSPIGQLRFYSSTADPSANTWTTVGSSSSPACEGSRIMCMKSSGIKNYFPAWGCTILSTARSIRVYNQSFMYLGNLNITLPSAAGNDNPPHANVFAYGTTAYFLSFDDTIFGTNAESMGNLIIATASISSSTACYASNPGPGVHKVAGATKLTGSQKVN